jgi:hypothetical protein
MILGLGIKTIFEYFMLFNAVAGVIGLTEN